MKHLNDAPPSPAAQPEVECERCQDSGYVELTSGGVWTGESLKNRLEICDCEHGNDVRREHAAPTPPDTDAAQATGGVVEALCLLVDAFLSRNGGYFPLDKVTEEQRLWNRAMLQAYAAVGQPGTPDRTAKLAALSRSEPQATGGVVEAGELRRYIDRCRELSAEGEYAWWSRLADILAALSQPHPADERVVEALVDKVLDAAGTYMGEQYGIAALHHPTDRARIKAALSTKEGRS